MYIAFIIFMQPMFAIVQLIDDLFIGNVGWDCTSQSRTRFAKSGINFHFKKLMKSIDKEVN